MLLLQRPSEEQVRAFLETQRGAAFSYAEVGASKAAAPDDNLARCPAGYVADHNRVKLGEGKAAFDLAVVAIQNWRMFDLGWVRLFFDDAPIAVGATVAVLARHLRFYSLNVCRIVYTIDESVEVRRYGFAYGTLTEHAERGEERFTVEWRKDDNSVWYDIFAFSRPNHWLARCGYPVTRAFQKRFARDSKQAMFNYVQKRLTSTSLSARSG